MINHATSSNLYRSYYPHRSRELVSPVCGIFFQHNPVTFPLFVPHAYKRAERIPYAGFLLEDHHSAPNNSSVCRTAPATLGLSNNSRISASSI